MNKIGKIDVSLIPLGARELSGRLAPVLGLHEDGTPIFLLFSDGKIEANWHALMRLKDAFEAGDVHNLPFTLQTPIALAVALWKARNT